LHNRFSCAKGTNIYVKQGGHSPVMIKFPDFFRHFKWLLTGQWGHSPSQQ